MDSIYTTIFDTVQMKYKDVCMMIAADNDVDIKIIEDALIKFADDITNS